MTKLCNYFNFKILLVRVNDKNAHITFDGNVELALFFDLKKYLEHRKMGDKK